MGRPLPAYRGYHELKDDFYKAMKFETSPPAHTSYAKRLDADRIGTHKEVESIKMGRGGR